MAAGAGDAWARDLTSDLNAINGPVWVAFHHEPEGDGDLKQWTAMQRRLSGIVRGGADNVAFTIIVTGWNQFYSGVPEYSLEALWPGDGIVDVVGMDTYNRYGEVKDGDRNDNFTELKVYYAKMKAFADAHDVAWGVAETGYTDEAATRDAAWLMRAYQDMKAMGGVALTYFDTILNSNANWQLSTPAKQQAFVQTLRASDKLADAR